MARELRYPGNKVASRDYQITFTSRDRSCPSGLPVRGQLTVQALSRLDAEVRLNQLLHKKQQRVHVILEVV